MDLRHWFRSVTLKLTSRPSLRLQASFGTLRMRTFETLCAFAKHLGTVTVSFVMSVCPSVRMEQLDSCRTNLYEILCLGDFQKDLSTAHRFRLTSDNINSTLQEDLLASVIYVTSFRR